MFAHIEIDVSKCKGCGLCTVSCPRNLIFLKNVGNDQHVYTAAFSDEGNCVGCAYCASICPDLAIKVFSLYKNEITGKLSKNFPCYRKIVNLLCC